MPSLAKNTTNLLVELHKRDFVLNPRLDQYGAKDIDLSQAFRAGIRELTLISKNMRYPDPSLFPNLEFIHVKLLPELSPNLENLRKDQLTDPWLLEVIKQQLNEQPLNSDLFQAYKIQQKKAVGAHLIVCQTFRFQARRYDIKNARQKVSRNSNSLSPLPSICCLLTLSLL